MQLPERSMRHSVFKTIFSSAATLSVRYTAQLQSFVSVSELCRTGIPARPFLTLNRDGQECPSYSLVGAAGRASVLCVATHAPLHVFPRITHSQMVSECREERGLMLEQQKKNPYLRWPIPRYSGFFIERLYKMSTAATEISDQPAQRGGFDRLIGRT